MRIGKGKYTYMFGQLKSDACIPSNNMNWFKIEKAVRDDLEKMRISFKRYKFAHIMEDVEMKNIVFESYWHKIVHVRDQFADENCDICGVEVIWWEDNCESNEKAGRMYNIDNTDILLRSHWMTLCKRCFGNIRQKEIWEEELNDYRLLKKDLRHLDELYNIFKDEETIQHYMRIIPMSERS